MWADVKVAVLGISFAALEMQDICRMIFLKRKLKARSAFYDALSILRIGISNRRTLAPFLIHTLQRAIQSHVGILFRSPLRDE